MFVESDILRAHLRAMLVASFIMWTYWLKEIMEHVLRVVFGVDRRMMYVPVAQNTYTDIADIPLLGGTRIFQRGELFYFVFHSTVSVSLAFICYIMSLYTPEPKPLGYALYGTK